MKSLDRVLLIFTFFFLTLSCSSKPKGQELNSQTEFDKILIGESAKKIFETFGSGAKDNEIYNSIQFETINFNDDKNRPHIFFTIDNQANIIAKNMWVYPNQKFYNLESLLKTVFIGISFKKYVPCQTRGSNDWILVNKEKGIYLATSNESVSFIAWTTPQLIDLRLQSLFNKCPQLQPKN